jgi:phosphomethylpyrimidine synthase
MTQLIKAKNKELTPEVEAIAQKEGLNPNELMQKVAEGRVVVLKNINHKM